MHVVCTFNKGRLWNIPCDYLIPHTCGKKESWKTPMDRINAVGFTIKCNPIGYYLGELIYFSDAAGWCCRRSVQLESSMLQ